MKRKTDKAPTEEQIKILRDARSLVKPIKDQLSFKETQDWIEFLRL